MGLGAGHGESRRSHRASLANLGNASGLSFLNRLLSPSSTRAIALTLFLGVCASAHAVDRPPIVAQRNDAFIAHQTGSDLWWIGSANLELVVGFDASRALALQRLSNPTTGRVWDIAP